MVDGYGAWSSFMDHDKISEDDFFERSKPLYKRLIENVVKQKERLGGTFAVAHAIPIRKTREYMSEIAGADLIFIVMNLSNNCVAARLKQWHGDSGITTALAKMHSKFQPAGEGERNSYNVTIEENMSKQEVMQKILDILNTIG